MSKNKLLAASKGVVQKKNEHCLVLTLSQDRTNVEASGDNVWIKAALENPDLFAKLKDALVTAAENLEPEQKLLHERFPKTYPKLFACPGTKKWKGVKILSQLSNYLAFHGYGHNMPMRYGENEPPFGWPTLVDWATFKGPSKNCSFTLCTEIIMQLLEAKGLNPMDYYIKTEGYDSDLSSDTDDDEGEDEEHQTRKRKVVAISNNVVETIANVQELEERNGPAFKRRRKNIEELEEGLKALEDGEISEDANGNANS